MSEENNSTPVAFEPPEERRTLSDILADGYDIVGVHHEPFGDAFIVVGPKDDVAKQFAVSRPTSSDMLEMGSAAPSPWTGWTRQEYNRDLQGLKGLEKYDQMRRSDATVRSSLRVAKTPVLAARWYVEPASDSKRDKNVADFVWKCFTEYMSISFPQLVTEAMLMLDFGYYMFEKVYESRVVDGKTRIIWKKLAPRHPMDVKEWHYDSNGGPLAVTMYAPSAVEMMTGLQDGVMQGPVSQEVTIPISKLVVFTFDKEAGNVEGVSLLRSAYKHWYYKDNLYKIDAIQKERHGIGVPIIKLPPNFTRQDKELANELGRNLRTNERAHVVLPPNWEIVFAKLEGQPVDAMKSAEHHDTLIQTNILASFLKPTVTTQEEDQAIFLKATRFIADIITGTFNAYCIPQLVDFNFGRMRSGYPQLKARRIGENADWRTMSFAIRNLIGAKAIIPDDPLEDLLREEMDLPRADPETARETDTPQGPDDPEDKIGDTSPPSAGKARVGPPRQTKPSAKPPSPNAGRDRSGG